MDCSRRARRDKQRHAAAQSSIRRYAAEMGSPAIRILVANVILVQRTAAWAFRAATGRILHVMDTRPAIRAATTNDASVLAALHVQARQWAYRDQLPNAFLDELTATIPRREAWRREMLMEPLAERTWVAEIAGRVVGFADTGPSRDA